MAVYKTGQVLDVTFVIPRITVIIVPTRAVVIVMKQPAIVTLACVHLDVRRDSSAKNVTVIAVVVLQSVIELQGFAKETVKSESSENFVTKRAWKHVKTDVIDLMECVIVVLLDFLGNCVIMYVVIARQNATKTRGNAEEAVKSANLEISVIKVVIMDV